MAKRGSVRTAHVCRDAHVVLYAKVSRCLVDARACDLYKSAANKQLRTELEVFNVEVPVLFFGTVGFSARVEG